MALTEASWTHWDLRRVIDRERYTGMARFAALYFLYTSPDRCLVTVARMFGSECIQAADLISTPIVVSGRAREC